MQTAFNVFVLVVLAYLWYRQRGRVLKSEPDNTSTTPEPTVADRIKAAIDKHEAELHPNRR